MAPERPLPCSEQFRNPDEYVSALSEFTTSSHMFQTLCGGVHILDFMTQDPDLYTTVLPLDWREWLENVGIADFLELLMRDDLSSLYGMLRPNPGLNGINRTSQAKLWRQHALPPDSLLDYIGTVRRLSLDRSFKFAENATEYKKPEKLTRQLVVGMTPKKAHEVENFASFVNDLADEISATSEGPIDYLLDFGSGQNYLGRVLASPIYSHQVIAVERKHSNVNGARKMDVTAKISKKECVWRNKKQWRATSIDTAQKERETQLAKKPTADFPISSNHSTSTIDHQARSSPGRVLHIEHDLQDGDLEFVIQQINGGMYAPENSHSSSIGRGRSERSANDNRVLCISLHSCGNLSHHGIRSLVLNSFVKGVALVGCCYNLVTERLGPPTYKLPSLRTANERLERTSSSYDPHGFPMSERMATYEHRYGKGVRLNITARMMAVQAPENWTESECESFFTRHFYRALLQKIFLDKGFVDPPTVEQDLLGGVSPAGSSGLGQTVILGALRKSCYTSFISYVRGAISKLKNDPERGAFLLECMNGLTDDEIVRYERDFQHKKHHLCLVWSLMAFSAAVVEAAIVTDRWLFLAEQPSVRDCWVQTVFDYKQSPRNLVVVGLK